MNCSKCGNALQPGWKACPSCGLVFEQPVPTVTINSRRKSFLIPSIIGCVIISGAIGFAVIAAYVGKAARESAPQVITTPASVSVREFMGDVQPGTPFRDVLAKYGIPTKTAFVDAFLYQCRDGSVVVRVYEDSDHQVPAINPDMPGEMEPSIRVRDTAPAN